MKSLFNAIEAHKNALCQHSFCQLLNHTPCTEKGSFAFIPHMTFFVLGFKDMLENLRIKQPQTTMDKMINEHCSEDSDHWEWFLQDLRTLEMDIQYWGGDISSIVKLIWAENNFPVRNQVYRVMHYIFQCKTPSEKLLLIECLEAAFAAFVVNLNVLSQKAGLYTRLKYFGEHHYDKESNHAMGSWLDEQQPKTPMPEQAKYSVREELMQYMIDDIFAGFAKVFSAWEIALHEANFQAALPISSAA